MHDVPAPKRTPAAAVAKAAAAKPPRTRPAARTTRAPELKPGPPPPRIRIENPYPTVDAGRFPAKRCVGDAVDVAADIIRDGHDVLRACIRYKGPGERRWRESPLTHIDAHLKGDRWAGAFTVEEMGDWTFTIQAWTDPFAAWREELERKIAFGEPDLSPELQEGALMLREAAGRAKGADEQVIEHALKTLEDPDAPATAKYDAALGTELYAAVEKFQQRHECTTYEPNLTVEVDRVRARFSTWYELFPRSFGGLKGVTEQVPRIAELGFDVLYLPPIHPIGEKNRKGRNNAVTAGADDPGSPWAIGHHVHGGHEAIHPELGSREDFIELVRTAREHGVEIALDWALNASADHPWLTEHPEWFNARPDGTLKYAENPPKKYQDIYNFNWSSEDWQGLWQAFYEILREWVDMGVRIFRVDNPHTKPFAFWEWLIEEIRRDDPDVLFLAEAFTRRKVMQELAKLGFNQSYTYFTWKNWRWELVEYVNELAHGPEREYFRPNFFVNTPDILPDYLVQGGPAAFYIRHVLAALLSPTYGIYSGFENYENVPREPGSEEYLDSEKFEARQRTLDGPMLPFIKRINEIRHEHPALQQLTNVRFLDTENEALVAFTKRWGDDTIIAIVNIDPHHAQEGTAVVPYELGLPPAFAVEDLLSGERFDWRLGRNYVRLDPYHRVAHVLAVRTA
jgi:starch synthase (maltosyl-transferring)